MGTIGTNEIAHLLREKYSGEESPAFFEDIKRLESGEPLAYVIGNIPFLGCTIDLSYRPFIPRPETEWWLEKALAVIKERTPNTASLRLLDVFSGSGAIGVAAAKNLPGSSVDFSEYDARLVAQIKKNISQNDIAETRTSVRAADGITELLGPYDYILSNPPYISSSRRDRVDKSVLDWEPERALFSDDNGLAVVKPFLADAPRILRPSGMLFMEFGERQKDTLEEVLYDLPFTCEFWRDQYGFWRTLVATKNG